MLNIKQALKSLGKLPAGFQNPFWTPGSMESPILAPSILAADHTRLADDVEAVEIIGIHWLHIDIMDGHFVPNITIGPAVVGQIRKITEMKLDVHLMIEKPEEFIPKFIL